MVYIAVKSTWGQPGVNLGSTWGQPGVNLGSSWGQAAPPHQDGLHGEVVLPGGPLGEDGRGAQRVAVDFREQLRDDVGARHAEVRSESRGGALRARGEHAPRLVVVAVWRKLRLKPMFESSLSRFRFKRCEQVR